MMHLLKRLRKRIADLCYRIDNYRHYRSKGLPMRGAWKKSDLTL